MSKRINKEKNGLVVKTTVRILKDQYDWLKKLTEQSRQDGNYQSMNDYVAEAIELLKQQKVH